MVENDEQMPAGDVDAVDTDRATVTSGEAGKYAALRFHAFHPLPLGITENRATSAPMPSVDHESILHEPDLSVTNMPPQGLVADTPSPSTLGRGEDTSGRRAGKPIKTDTLRSYVETARSLIAQYCDQNRIPDEIELPYTDFANWLLGIQPLYQRSTWRTYKNAAIFFLDGLNDPNARDAAARLQADNAHAEANENSRAQRKDGKRGPIGAESLSYKNYLALMHAARRVRHKGGVGEHLADFIDATLVTGLRPTEWEATEIFREPGGATDGERVYLRVLSRDEANNPRQPIVRVLDISTIDDSRRAAIERFSTVGAAWAGAGRFHSSLDRLKREFQRVCRNTPSFQHGPNPVTPYTLRHQFIANAKAQFTLVEFAALLGYNDIEAAVRHYRGRGNGWAPGECPAMPTPSPGDVALVHGRIEAYREKVLDVRINRGYDIGDQKVMRETTGTASG